MCKKGLFVAVLMLLLFGGCDSATQSEERALPTLAPEVVEQEDETSWESVEKEDVQEEEEDSSYGILSYIDKSKQAKDENTADTLEFAVEVACIEAQLNGMVFPQTPIRFRYTHELDELDDSYGMLKEIIREIRGNDRVLELSGEGNYMMVEISADGAGNPKVNVELLQE